jgi:hypothetical protein
MAGSWGRADATAAIVNFILAMVLAEEEGGSN